jgi:outer membrane protein OmpA-like peptidoglycan-associated protein
MPQYLRINFILKTSFLALLYLLLAQCSIAQSKYGIVAGTGKTSLYKFPFSPSDYNRYSSTSSLWAGITADFPIKKNDLSLVIASVYNKKGYKYLMQKETGANNTVKDSSFNQSVKYVDLNLSLRKKFIFSERNSFFAGTGPVIHFFTTGKEQIQADYFGAVVPPVNNKISKLSVGNGAGKYKRNFFSWGFAAGFEFNNFSVSVNANIPLDDYFQDNQNAVKHKIKTFGINVGYTLIKHVKNEPKTKKEKNIYVPVIIDSLADTDGDGIANMYDKCPGHKGTLKYFGCPVPDTDGDGINDDDDKCITIAGIAANNGCPAYADTVAVDKDTIRYIVYFEPGKSILRSEAYNTLSMVIKQLKENPKLVATFTGHTDNVGSVEANYKRSLGRATVCADHVASYYVNKNRLMIFSRGNKMPAADLSDPLLQWKNRRVEIALFERKE